MGQTLHPIEVIRPSLSIIYYAHGNYAQTSSNFWPNTYFHFLIVGFGSIGSCSKYMRFAKRIMHCLMKFNIRINRLCILECFKERMLIWVKSSIGGESKSLEPNNSLYLNFNHGGFSGAMIHKRRQENNLMNSKYKDNKTCI